MVSRPVYSVSYISQKIRDTLRTYACYYLISLIYNAGLLSFYAVQTFAIHHPCLTKGGKNITNSFENAFMVGFVVVTADAIISNYLYIYFRFKA